MGVLDDAIREHLELKRRHGASEEELAEKEHEALGGARGQAPPEPAPEREEGAAEDAEPEPAGEDLPFDGDSLDTFVGERPAPAEDAPPAAREVVDQPTEYMDPPVEEEPPPRESSMADEPFAADAGPIRREPPPPEPDPADDPRMSDIVDRHTEYHPPPDPPTGESDAVAPWEEQEPPAEAEPGGEGESDDVLEETPDFLQETPEHDRLWFEQKPPRDFDFDDEEK